MRPSLLLFGFCVLAAVDAGAVADDSARISIIEALGGWLFLPKLEAGQRVSVMVNVPLQF